MKAESDVTMYLLATWCQVLLKKSGPSNHFFNLLKLACMPLEARSTGFKFDGTQCQHLNVVFCSITAKKLGANTEKHLPYFACNEVRQ